VAGGGRDSEDITVGANSIFSRRRKVSNFNLLYLRSRCARKAPFSAFYAAWTGLF
jgi:hypothetical protein